jgi:hypothetical protein
VGWFEDLKARFAKASQETRDEATKAAASAAARAAMQRGADALGAAVDGVLGDAEARLAAAQQAREGRDAEGALPSSEATDPEWAAGLKHTEAEARDARRRDLRELGRERRAVELDREARARAELEALKRAARGDPDEPGA